MRHESPDGFGVHLIELEEAETNARDGQVLADLLEWKWLDLAEVCRETESVGDQITWLGLVSGDFSDDGHGSQRSTVRVGGRR